MTDVDAGLILEILKRLQSDMADVKQELRDVRLRLSVLESHMQGVIAGQQLANERLDRLDERMARIERRLDLVEAH